MTWYWWIAILLTTNFATLILTACLRVSGEADQQEKKERARK